MIPPARDHPPVNVHGIDVAVVGATCAASAGVGVIIGGDTEAMGIDVGVAVGGSGGSEIGVGDVQAKDTSTSNKTNRRTDKKEPPCKPRRLGNATHP